MPIVLRIDVEKPYGNHKLPRKLLSKFVEDFYPDAPKFWGYLSHLKELIKLFDQAGVKAMFFHRLCNLPDQEVIEMYKSGGHALCFHFENSRSKETLANEIAIFNQAVGEPCKIISKHGSGYYKLGKYHYPKYEPLKYRQWASELGVKFPIGNGIPEKDSDLESVDGYFENVFWLEADYRHLGLNSLDKVIEYAKNSDVVILGHPESFFNIKQVENDFRFLLKKSIENQIEWKIL